MIRPFSRRRQNHLGWGIRHVLCLGLAVVIAPRQAGAEGPPAGVTLQANQASKRGAGSATRLSGHVVMYEIFVSDDLSSWPRSQRRETSQRLDAAATFLQRQARLYDHSFTWQRVPGRDVQHSGRLPLDPHADPAWSETVLRKSAGMSGSELVWHLRQQHAADQVGVCLHINQSGVSYNLAFYEQVRPEYAAERMICFSDYPDGRSTATATYAHELLHLFGAGDLYFPYDESSDRKELARRSFPDDIMLRVDYQLQRLTVGPFTAFRVGWRDTLEPRWQSLED